MDSPTPPSEFVDDLHRYDRTLRVRWATHTKKWFVEKRMQRRSPQLVSEKPSEARSGLTKDLWEGWKDGYVHVLTIPTEMLHWNLIVEALANADAWRQGGMEALNRQLDAENEKWERATDRNIENFTEAATDDAFERLQWLQGNRISTIQTSAPAYE